MKKGGSRREFLAAAGGVFLAGCIRSDSRPLGRRNEEPTDGVMEFMFAHEFESVTVGDNPPEDEPIDAPPFSDRVLPLPTDPSSLQSRIHVSGGARKDGIPSIDNPVFAPADGAAFLDGESVVLGVVGETESKAYPEGILVQHEIVNDVIDGNPVSITFCPLTGTAQGFCRGRTEFGVSGLLLNNNLVMYDRNLCRLWPQILATSTPGPLFWANTPGGATLQEFGVVRTTWEKWRSVFPDTTVLTEDTGFARDYRRDPYARSGYYERDGTLFPNLFTDDRYHAKTWVYGARTAEGAVGFLKQTLVSVGIIHGRIGDTPHVAVYNPTLDTAHVYRNHEDRSFTYEDGTVFGSNGESYSPDSLPLQSVLSFDAYWFAWIASYPQTIMYE